MDIRRNVSKWEWLVAVLVMAGIFVWFNRANAAEKGTKGIVVAGAVACGAEAITEQNIAALTRFEELVVKDQAGGQFTDQEIIDGYILTNKPCGEINGDYVAVVVDETEPFVLFEFDDEPGYLITRSKNFLTGSGN